MGTQTGTHGAAVEAHSDERRRLHLVHQPAGKDLHKRALQVVDSIGPAQPIAAAAVPAEHAEQRGHAPIRVQHATSSAVLVVQQPELELGLRPAALTLGPGEENMLRDGGRRRCRRLAAVLWQMKDALAAEESLGTCI